jgi:HD-GYP domain-containing protein (c-di-GMP phosphodiesterase class II)
MKVVEVVAVQDLRPGMVLAENLFDQDGNVLLSVGMILKQSFIHKIFETHLISVRIETIEDTLDHSADEIEVDGQDVVHAVFQAREQAREVIKRSLQEVLIHNAVNGDLILSVVNKIIEELLNQEDIVINLNKLQLVDDYLFEHSVNVSIYSIITGIMMGLNKEKLVILGTGAMMHDVGKMMLEKEILNKPGLLSDEEFQYVKQHTTMGYDLLMRTQRIHPDAAMIALNHHERLDGNGYPKGSSVSDISILSKIVSVVDVFDALTSDRVYSKRINHFKAMEYICSMIDVHFDEMVTKTFIKTVGYFYRGLVLQLSNGDIGVVIREDKALPVVKIVIDSHNQKVTNNFEVDLKKNPTVRIQDVFLRNRQMLIDDIVDQIS